MRILTFKRVIATVNRPPLMPVHMNICVRLAEGRKEGKGNEAGQPLLEKTDKAALHRRAQLSIDNTALADKEAAHL